MTEKPFDPMNDYGLERKIFNLMADCINCLCEFEEITVAQVETREDGLDIHLWSERYQHQIEIDRELNTVTLAILPLDGVTAVPVFTAEADEASSVRESSDACSSAGVACSPCGQSGRDLGSWLRLRHLVMGAEGYVTGGGEGIVETLRKLGFSP